MTTDKTKAQQPGPAAVERARQQAEERQRRSAEALRANLRRRKEQQQAQQDEPLAETVPLDETPA